MKILSEYKIGSLKLKNRICISPMCQYSAKNGNPTQWHYDHLSKLVNSGAGLLMLESTAVSRKGMISVRDLSLCNKRNEKELKKLIKFLKKKSDTRIGLQLSHSGRKGSSMLPWVKSNHPIKNRKLSWKTLAPSAIKRDRHWPKPKQLSQNEIKKILQDFVLSARRAKKIDFDCLEIHMSHGYLLHQFFHQFLIKEKIFMEEIFKIDADFY